MIRIILFRLDGTGEWTEGVVHSLTGERGVVENKATGELHAVKIDPAHLKFKITTEEWVKMQMEAQRQAQGQSVVAPAAAAGRLFRA